MSKLKVMYFSATWCGPCRVYKPAFTEVVNSFGDEIDVQIVDADEESQVLADHAVRSIPTTIMFKDGKEVFRQVSIIDKKTLKDTIKKHK
jgi:thioredoxin 1